MQRSLKAMQLRSPLNLLWSVSQTALWLTHILMGMPPSQCVLAPARPALAPKVVQPLLQLQSLLGPRQAWWSSRTWGAWGTIQMRSMLIPPQHGPTLRAVRVRAAALGAAQQRPLRLLQRPCPPQLQNMQHKGRQLTAPVRTPWTLLQVSLGQIVHLSRSRHLLRSGGEEEAQGALRPRG